LRLNIKLNGTRPVESATPAAAMTAS
jgi:hypothetical protein